MAFSFSGRILALSEIFSFRHLIDIHARCNRSPLIDLPDNDVGSESWSREEEAWINLIEDHDIWEAVADGMRWRREIRYEPDLIRDIRASGAFPIVGDFPLYASAEGLMERERQHARQLMGDEDGDDSALADAFDEAFNEIHKSAEGRGHDCPEDAVAFIQEQLRWALSSPGDVDGDGDDEDSYLVEKGFQGLNMNNPDTITLTSFENELDADREARNHYDDIIDRLKAFKKEAERLGVWVE